VKAPAANSTPNRPRLEKDETCLQASKARKLNVTCSGFLGSFVPENSRFAGWPGRRGRAIKKSRFSDRQIAFILRQAAEGMAVEEVYLDRRALLGELAVDGEHMSFAVWKLANPG